jgi:hypothetical protein
MMEFVNEVCVLRRERHVRQIVRDGAVLAKW